MIKRYFLFAALLLNHGLIADRAHAQEQPKEITITVSPAELGKIGQALGKEPFVDVAALMAKLQAQFNKQQPVAADANGNKAEPAK